MAGLADVRAELVSALDGLTVTVDGQSAILSAYAQQPHPVVAWDAWPVWQATRPIAMCIAETDWQMVVALPGADPQTFTETGDAAVDAVADALAAYQVVRIQPGQLALTEGGTVPILIYTLTV